MSAAPRSAEEAVEEFLARRRRGEAVEPAKYAAEHPELEPDLSLALETLLALESATGVEETYVLSVPERIGSYRIVREIGRGGMGVVLEALEDPLGRRVALKVLPAELLASPSARGRFRREAELAARLDHSGIATVYGAGVEDERPWIAMRYVEGRTLAQSISASKEAGESCVRLDPSISRGRELALAVAALVAKLARALHSAHEQGVVHRDIKPSNVIVQPDGSPVLLDFGLAIEEESDGRTLTRTGEAPGTPAYLAPETVAGEIARPDAQSDVYALGVLLYECLALRRPFEAPTPAALYRAILAGSATSLRSLNPAVPRDLAVVAATAMERERQRRYRSALALAEDLEACVAGRPIAARPVPLHGRLLRWARREPRLSAAIGGSIAIAVAAFLWVSSAKSQAEENERIATQRAEDVLSLSAIQELKEVVEEANVLWPALPDKIDAYDEWIAKARMLVDGRGSHPGLEDHRKKLAEIRLRAKLADGEPAVHEFDDPKDRWWHAQLEQLVADLESFTDEETGLLSEGTSEEHGWGVPRRLEEATTIEDRSVYGQEAKRRWEEATDAIAASPQYGGLKLQPQMGLLPIGPDAASGLWEFAHLQSGDPPQRDAGGKITVTDTMGLVLVLIPGGSSWMGCQAADPTERNFDPQADVDEGPVHEVELVPFFISKYEMTQAQWTRFAGRNPSYYPAGSLFDGRRTTLGHPVENVSWEDCTETLRRLGLSLPSEAQWEAACRGGTSSVWSSGDDRESLLGKINVADRAFVRAGGPEAIASHWPDLDDGWGAHAPVGTFEPSPFGLHEVHGNVHEWCRDDLVGYEVPAGPGDGVRLVPGSPTRVIRGGAFNGGISATRSAHRYFGTPVYSDDILGVRPARAVTRD